MQCRFMNPIILKNSSTLREAFVFELPVQKGILYPQLILLNCVSMEPEVPTVRPRLKELNAFLRDAATLGLLSSDKMETLETLKFNPKLIIGGTSALIEKLQQFKHLNDLSIEALDPYPRHREWERPVHPYSILRWRLSGSEKRFIDG